MKITIMSKKAWTDPKTGGLRQLSRKFEQDFVPSNVNAEGKPKTRKEILRELEAQRAAWMAEPLDGAAPVAAVPAAPTPPKP